MRFISQDSYRGTQTDVNTWHLYQYCSGNPINYTDPTGHKGRKVVITGNPFENRDGNLFINAANTWKKEHGKGANMIWGSNYKNANQIMDRLAKISKTRKIKKLVYFGHSNDSFLGPYEESGSKYNIYVDSKWDKVKFTKNAKIRIFGCNVGGEGKRSNSSFSARLARRVNRNVYAYITKSFFTNDKSLGHYKRRPTDADTKKTVKNGDTWLIPYGYASSGIGRNNAFAKFTP